LPDVIIVAKVEALLALCDALAAGGVQAEEVSVRWLQAVLEREENTTGR
jgi:2-keto-3-deoxy-6-phosphogluconate aldolase